MKIRYGAIVIILASALGMVLFSLTPLVSGKSSVYVNEDNWSETRKRVFGFGDGIIKTEGKLLGISFSNDIDVTREDWGKDFPLYVPILVMTGLGLAIIAGIFFFFAGKNDIKKIAVILGIVGGVVALTGILVFIDWGQWFLSNNENSYYNIGFIATIIASTIAILFSVIYIFNKPDRRKKVIY